MHGHVLTLFCAYIPLLPGVNCQCKFTRVQEEL